MYHLVNNRDTVSEMHVHVTVRLLTNGKCWGIVMLALYVYVSPFTIGQVIPVPQAFVG